MRAPLLFRRTERSGKERRLACAIESAYGELGSATVQVGTSKDTLRQTDGREGSGSVDDPAGEAVNISVTLVASPLTLSLDACRRSGEPQDRERISVQDAFNFSVGQPWQASPLYQVHAATQPIDCLLRRCHGIV